MESVGGVVLTGVGAFEMTDVRSHGLTASADSMNLPHHIAVGATWSSSLSSESLTRFHTEVMSSS